MSEVKILLCDDDPALMGLLERRLKKMGIEPDAAADGRQAKAFVDENEYDVIVTDIYMPEATGLEVMQYAKQKDPEVQVVIITSSATLENAIDALNHGAFGYLTKPFDHLIVFDNMVSRALEYRTLIVADKRKAEAQKRRGDLLEDEVEQRVKQLQKTQKGLLDLLGSLPDGVLVVEEGGKVVLSSPVGERWLAQDDKTEDRLIHAFINQVHAESPENMGDVTINETELHLMVADFPSESDRKRKAVIIREVEEDAAGAGSMVTETVMGIKKGLATLYEQGVGTEVVLNVASQFAVLEQLQGWSGGTGKLADRPALADDPALMPDAPTPASAAPPVETPSQTSEDISQTDSSEQVQPPSSETPAQGAPGAQEVTSVPPFTIPRERTPTGELDGPRLNTSELQDALRAAASPDAGVEATDAVADQPESLSDMSEPPTNDALEVDPMADTLVASQAEVAEQSTESVPPSKPSPDEEVSDTPSSAEVTGKPDEEMSPIEQVEAMARAHAMADSGEPDASAPPDSAEVPSEPVSEVAAQAELAGPAPSESEETPEAHGDVSPQIEETDAPPSDVVEPVTQSEATTLEDPVPADESIDENIEAGGPTSAEIENSVEPDTQPTGVAIPPKVDETTAPPLGDPAQASDSVDDSGSFPRVETDSGDIPTWIDGIKGSTDPDLLEDFEFEQEQSEATFPQAQTGELLEDDSMFKPRVIPEEMNAKLDTPVELPNANGEQEYVPPQHEGPITIQASEADTKMFRKVLEGLSGTNVLSGDYVKSAADPLPDNGDVVADENDGLDELRAEFVEAPEDEQSAELPEAEVQPTSPEDLRAVPEPEPESIRSEPSQWPPVLPTEDDEWDDELDISG